MKSPQQRDVRVVAQMKAATETETPRERHSAHWWIWLTIPLLFVLERVLARRSQ